MNKPLRFVALNAQLLPVAKHGGETVAELDTQQDLIFAIAGDAAARHTHADAQKLVADMDLGGQRDWRLPTVAELFATVDHGQHDPATQSAILGSTTEDWCWSSTPCAWAPGRASWCVVFSGGGVYYDFHGHECFVRAVRSASPAPGQ